MRWQRRFRTTGHSGAQLLNAGMGGRSLSVREALDDYLAAYVLFEALECLHERIEKEGYEPWEWMGQPASLGSFPEGRVRAAVQEARERHGHPSSNGVTWTIIMTRMHLEEVGRVVLEAYERDEIGPRAPARRMVLALTRWLS